MPKVTRIINNSQSEQKKKRTAAYCRVSTNSADQLNSYANQIKTYTQKINKNPEWELVDIFADEGLSGVSMDKRDDLSKMARGFKVSDETIRKITNVLNCKVEDIMEYVEVKNGTKQS